MTIEMPEDLINKNDKRQDQEVFNLNIHKDEKQMEPFKNIEFVKQIPMCIKTEAANNCYDYENKDFAEKSSLQEYSFSLKNIPKSNHDKLPPPTLENFRYIRKSISNRGCTVLKMNITISGDLDEKYEWELINNSLTDFMEYVETLLECNNPPTAKLYQEDTLYNICEDFNNLNIINVNAKDENLITKCPNCADEKLNDNSTKSVHCKHNEAIELEKQIAANLEVNNLNDCNENDELIEKGPIRQKDVKLIRKYAGPYMHEDSNYIRWSNDVNNNTENVRYQKNSTSTSLLHNSGCIVLEKDIKHEHESNEIISPNDFKELLQFVEKLWEDHKNSGDFIYLNEKPEIFTQVTTVARKLSTDTVDTAYFSMDSPEPENPKRYRKILPKPTSHEELRDKLESKKKQDHFVEKALLSEEELYKVDKQKTIFHKLLIPTVLPPDFLEAFYALVHRMKKNNPVKLVELLNVEPKFTELLKEKAVPWPQLIEKFLQEVFEEISNINKV